MQNSFSGIFTISCSTRGAPRAGTPIRSAELTPMRTSHLRRRRCGAAGPERRSISARSWARLAALRQPRGCCVNVIRSAASTMRDRSRSPRSHDFSTAPRVSCRRGKARSTSATSVRWSPMRRGRIPRRARATSSSSISRSANATGSCVDSTTTTPEGTRWCRSPWACRSSRRCSPKRSLPWTRPPRRRSSSPSRRDSAGYHGNTAHSPMRSF